MPDPVAWTVIEEGWKVVDSAGEEAGRVAEVTGDENADIFDGLTISRGILGKPRYVPSEHVAQIVEGEVQLSLSHREVEQLETYTEPVAERILPEGSSWYQRLTSWLGGRNR